jgi:hypothetical protein
LSKKCPVVRDACLLILISSLDARAALVDDLAAASMELRDDKLHCHTPPFVTIIRNLWLSRNLWLNRCAFSQIACQSLSVALLDVGYLCVLGGLDYGKCLQGWNSDLGRARIRSLINLMIVTVHSPNENPLALRVYGLDT